MGFIDWLFGNEAREQETRKKVFVSFAIEDVDYRDFLVDQARRKYSHFDFIDMSVKKEWSKMNGKKDVEVNKKV